MDTLKQLELKYSKDFHGYFEDLAALLFCMEYHQTHGVNRRINQPGIEADPIVVGGKRIAFQAKYYSDTVNLNDRKDDLLRSVDEAAREKVDKLIIYTNKDHSSTKNKKDDENKIEPRLKPAYEEEIDAHAKSYNMVIEWQTGSSINTTLEQPEYKSIRQLYLGLGDNKDGFIDFYDYSVNKVLAHEKDCIYGDIPLKDGYIEPFIMVNNESCSFKSYLSNWVSAQGNNAKNQIMIVYGEPGHGKTSLCYKAMYDYYKEGWLSSLVQNVFHVSLNPSFTNAVRDEKIDIKDLLCWGEFRQNKLFIDDFNNALVFFDGFDELIDYLPNLTLSEFIKTYISRFVDITNAKVVITTRRMGIERELSLDSVSKKHYIHYLPQYQVFELQPLTKEQQFNWITEYIHYCKNQSEQDTDAAIYWLTKANSLVEYSEFYREFLLRRSSVYSYSLLSIPLIFRMIVEFQYPPNNLSNSVRLYEELFDVTWERRPKDWQNCNTKENTIKKLAGHAFNCFQDGSDSAVTDATVDFFWTYQFYTKAIRTPEETTEPPKKMKSLLRVGFLHRTFYQYYLAKHVVLTLISPESHDESFLKNEVLARLSKEKLDYTTLQYIGDLYSLLSPSENSYSEKTVKIICSIIKRTDAVFPEIHNMHWVKEGSIQKRISPLEACNNLFWNMASIYTLTGHSNANDFCSSFALRHYSLRGANLESWKLDGFELYGANLENANLDGASLKKANLEGSFLRGATLIEAHLEEANLRRVYLNHANLKSAHLDQANLEKANLEGAFLKGAHLNGSFLNSAFLKGAHLEGAHFEKAHLEQAHLEETHFEEANLEGAHLEWAHLREAHLKKANLEKAHLERTYLKWSDFEEANLEGAYLEEAHLEYAHLVGAHLKEAHLEQAHLAGARLYKADLKGTYLEEAYLEGAYLEGAYLEEALFEENHPRWGR